MTDQGLVSWVGIACLMGAQLTGACDTTALEMAFDRIGAPLEVLHLDEPTFAMCMVLIAVAASGSSYFLAR
jgi:hypothetical protein